MKKIVSFVFLIAAVLFLSFTQVNTANKAVQPGKWEVLGSKVVNFQADHDEIIVTAYEGTFKRIKFKVLQAPIYVKNFRVIYGNGTSDNFVVNRHFKAGHDSRVIDLTGRNRIIKKININYKTVQVGKGRAKIVVFGKH
jgi:hypothetical protein